MRMLLLGLILFAGPASAQGAAQATLIAPPPPAATAAAAPAAPPKRICKSELETGSLVRRMKVCRTAAEWEAAYSSARNRGNEARRLGHHSCPPGMAC